jgi:hypothetical protein
LGNGWARLAVYFASRRAQLNRVTASPCRKTHKRVLIHEELLEIRVVHNQAGSARYLTNVNLGVLAGVRFNVTAGAAPSAARECSETYGNEN